jgi:RNA polymerase sigma-70 factor (ECF subfamily)
MTAPGRETRDGGGDRRAVVYCMVPADLARLHDDLRRHFRDDDGVEVVIERRGADRRRAAERRTNASPPPAAEQRRVRNAGGRRVGDRRALLSELAARPLPRRAQRHRDRLAFVERLEPSSEHLEDLDTARLVIAIQGGDAARLDDLYLRYFERVYSYLRLVLNDSHEAEDATQQVFLNVLKALPRYERRAQPFRAWLFAVVRNEGLNRLRGRGQLDVVDPVEMTRRTEADSVDDADLEALQWISDKDLVFLVERLPLAQRQVLMLRYLADLRAPEIAQILGRSADDVRMLQHRAQRYLRDRLVALGRGPSRRSKAPALRRVPEATVLRARRYCIARGGSRASAA